MNGLKITLLLCCIALSVSLHAREYKFDLLDNLPPDAMVIVPPDLQTVIVAPEATSDPNTVPNAIHPTPKTAACLAQAMYHEARGEGRVGMEAVAFVIYNRTQQPYWPHDICSVVFQRHQFTFTSRHYTIRQRDAYDNAIIIANNLLSGGFEHQNSPCKDATYFDSLAHKKKRGYSNGRQFITTIGHHHFFK
jgi:spore germination cell wall hydrolase CwlJ-like protein